MNEVTKSARAQAFHMEALIEKAVGSGEFDHIDIPVEHTFHGGVYARSIRIPKGAILTGHIHKYDNLHMLLYGVLQMQADDGVVELHGPQWICARSGIKRAARAMTDCLWITFLPTIETDPVVCERLFIVKTEEEYQNFVRLAMAERQGCLS